MGALRECDGLQPGCGTDSSSSDARNEKCSGACLDTCSSHRRTRGVLSALIENYGSEKPIYTNEAGPPEAAGGSSSCPRKRSARSQDPCDPVGDRVASRDAAAMTGLNFFPAAVFVPPVDHPFSWMVPASAGLHEVATQPEENCQQELQDAGAPETAPVRTQRASASGTELPFQLTVPDNPDVARPPSVGATDARDALPVPDRKPASPVPEAVTRERRPIRAGELPGAQVQKRGPATTERKPLPEVMTGEMRPRFVQVETAQDTPSRLLDRVAPQTADPAVAQLSAQVTAASDRHPARPGILLRESAVQDTKGDRPEVPGGTLPPLLARVPRKRRTTPVQTRIGMLTGRTGRARRTPMHGKRCRGGTSRCHRAG